MRHLRRDRTYTLRSTITPLAILRQSCMTSYVSVPLVTILKLSNRSNLSAIAWQASYDIHNNG